MHLSVHPFFDGSYPLPEIQLVYLKPDQQSRDKTKGCARGVMVIVVGNGHGDTSSNPGQDWLHFT